MEQIVSFENRGDRLFGTVHLPDSTSADAGERIGVVIYHGGKQARRGPHRLYTQLSRTLCDAGIIAFRYDNRGAGDSEGSEDGTIVDWISDALCATDFFMEEFGVERLHGWSLCSGAVLAANAAARFADAFESLVLCNPLFYTDVGTGIAAEIISGTFGDSALKRFRESPRAFLARSAKVVRRSLTRSAYEREFNANLDQAVLSFPVALGEAAKPTLLLFGDRDPLFKQLDVKFYQHPEWSRALTRFDHQLKVIDGADHVFAHIGHKQTVIQETLDWVMGGADDDTQRLAK